LGRSVTQHKQVSEETARKIDDAVRGVIDTAYGTARRILVESMDKLHGMAQALLQYETIDREQIAAIMDGRDPPPPADWNKDESGRNGNGSAQIKIGRPAAQT